MRTFKIILLSLGVVLGYGFGIAHAVHHYHHRHEYGRMHDCMHACAADAHGYGDHGHHRGGGPRAHQAPPASGPDTSMR